jgi:hypothetical protein
MTTSCRNGHEAQLAALKLDSFTADFEVDGSRAPAVSAECVPRLLDAMGGIDE